MCYSEFYVDATTLADVGQWLTCESMALPVVLGAFYLQNRFGDANTAALGQKCSFCTDTPSPPAALPIQITDPQHVRGIQTIVTTLDWSHKLLNVQGLGLRKAIGSLIAAVVTDKVQSGLLLAVHNVTGNIVQTAITRGFNPPTTYGSKKLLRRGANATDEAFQLMNSSIEVTATFQIVALEPNYTFAQVQTDINSALKNGNFTSLLAEMNANITSQNFETFIPAQASATSSVASASGSAATGSVTSSAAASASATAKSGAGRTGRSELRIGLIVGLVIAMVLIPCLMFNFWLFSVYF